MDYQQPMRRRRRRRRPSFWQKTIPPLIMVAVLLFGTIVGLESIGTAAKDPTMMENQPQENGTLPGDSTDPLPTDPPNGVVATATIGAMGDMILHDRVIKGGETSTGVYNFDNIFSYMTATVTTVDYSVINMEGTLCGDENGYAYKGYPRFNAPDAIVDAAKDAGFDMMLTANNHCYDTRTTGVTRTLEVVRGLGLETLGTQAADGAKNLVREINGIAVGMLCYSYATKDDYPDRPSMNGILTGESAKGMINYFDYDNLSKFYTEVENHLAAMEAAGAEATVMYIHWGEEYQLKANANQTAIAQKLCDLGIDVIVGGHPHVVQPVELLTSTTDDSHKTVCLYSMGNAISNQRKTNMNLSTGHTEDGVLFSFTFAEYSDGTVRLDDVEILPTWVYMGTENNNRVYRIIPLDQQVSGWGSAFGLSDSNVTAAEKSYERTMDLVGEGINASKEYLTAQRELALSTISE